MLYYANHYVRHDGVTHIPGEVFDAAFDAETLERLLKLNAIKECSAPDAAVLPDMTDALPDAETLFAPDAETEEAEADEPAPEIDVMDGIGIAEESAAPVMPKRRKRAAK